MTHAPISFTSWPLVPQKNKDDIWNAIQSEFEVPSHLRENIQRAMSTAFRKKKTNVRKYHLDMHSNLEEQKLDIPKGIVKEDWEQFCVNESDPKQIEFRAKAVENRKKSMYGHTGGRKSAAMVRYEMAADRKGSTVTRSEVWLKTHKRKDGKSLPGAELFVEQVEAVIKESKQSEGGSSGLHPLAIDNDPLTQVLGKKGKTLAGVGTFVSKRKYNATLHSQIECSEEKNKKIGLEKKVDDMKADLDFVVAYCKGHVTGATTTPIPIPRTTHTRLPEITTLPTHNTVSRSSLSHSTTHARDPSLDTGNSTTFTPIDEVHSPRFVELLDWSKNCVALATEVTDPLHKDTCHNYRVNEYEMKVSMCVRKIYPAKLYKETPDAMTIKDVGLGDFLVWPKSHILFRELRDAN